MTALRDRLAAAPWLEWAKKGALIGAGLVLLGLIGWGIFGLVLLGVPDDAR